MKFQTLSIIFHDHFDLFLKHHCNAGPIIYPLTRNASIKDIIESLGVPHTEIGTIKIKDSEVGFNYIPNHSANMSVLPVQKPFDIKKASLLRPAPLKSISFIVDENVGKLASLLRTLGMDAVYYPGIKDKEIASIAENQQRVVLSKDTNLFKRKQIIFGRYIRAVHPYEQLKEVIDFFGITGSFSSFSRCLICNTKLDHVNKEMIVHRLKPKTKKYYNNFKICRKCDKIVWRGSHCEKMTCLMGKAGITL